MPDSFIHDYDPSQYLTKKYASISAIDEIEKIIALDFESYLPEDLLVKVDRASMAHALEVRSPFLDHKLIELLAQIPMNQKIKYFKLKYLLKYKLLKNILPREVMFRPKMGFGVPLHEWFKKDLFDFVYDNLMNGISANALNMDKKYIKKIIIDHRNEICNNSSKIWNLLMLEFWYQQNQKINDGSQNNYLAGKS